MGQPKTQNKIGMPYRANAPLTSAKASLSSATGFEPAKINSTSANHKFLGNDPRGPMNLSHNTRNGTALKVAGDGHRLKDGVHVNKTLQ